MFGFDLIVPGHAFIHVKDGVVDGACRFQLEQKSLRGDPNLMLRCLDVVQGQEVLDSRNKLWGVEFFHQPVKVVLVEIISDHVQALVLSLARVVNRTSVTIFLLVLAQNDVEQVKHGCFYNFEEAGGPSVELVHHATSWSGWSLIRSVMGGVK